MSIDVLNVKRFEPDDQAVDIGLPVLAYECEAMPPLDNDLDAYERAVLRLIQLGFSSGGIAKTLNATESLIDRVLGRLDRKQYAVKKTGRPWEITDDGVRYLNGTIKERASAEAQYGYMFVNAIKKEVLPFFYRGDIRRIATFRQPTLRLTIGGDELETFEKRPIKNSKLRKAYKAYIRNSKEIANSEAEPDTDDTVDLFADEEDFEEETNYTDDTDVAELAGGAGELKGNMLIRALNKDPIQAYLRMRIVIDPTYPGGYKVESPLDYDGYDNSYFLHQIQWLQNAENIYLGEDPICDFLEREIRKWGPLYKCSEKDFRAFALEKMPALLHCPSSLSGVYNDIERIYSLMQSPNSILTQKNIVSALSTDAVELLFNAYFKKINKADLYQVRQKALDDIRTYGFERYTDDLGNVFGMDTGLRMIKKNVVDRLPNTYGNSVEEKFLNMMVFDFHHGNELIHRYLTLPNISERYENIRLLNKIRNKVSHNTDNAFTQQDYDDYIAHVFELINDLVKVLKGE